MKPEESNQQQAGNEEKESSFQKAMEDAATGSNSGVGSITDALEAGAADISHDSKGKKEGDTPAGEPAQTTSGV